MLYSREALLKKSIEEFRDNENNVLVYETRRISTSSGFTYIIKQPNPKAISCAIHTADSWDADWFNGKSQNTEVTINTRVQIPTDAIIDYKDIEIAVSSVEDYNETMQQWHYRATAAYGYLSSKFIILDESEIEQNLAVDCMPQLFEALTSVTKIPVFPSFFVTISNIKNQKLKYISIDIEDTECIGVTKSVLDKDMTETLVQNNTDRVRLAFVNLNADETYEVITALENVLTDKLGLVSTPRIYHKKVFQKSFNAKALIHICELSINYNLVVKPGREAIKIIKDCLISQLSLI